MIETASQAPPYPEAPPDWAHPALHRMHRYWQDKAAGRAMPRRDEVDPAIDLFPILPHIMLLEVRAAAPHFLIKVMGGELVRFRQHNKIRNPVGHYLEEIDFYGQAERNIQPCLTALRERRCVFAAWDFPVGTDSFGLYQGFGGPLGDGATVTHLLAAITISTMHRDPPLQARWAELAARMSKDNGNGRGA